MEEDSKREDSSRHGREDEGILKLSGVEFSKASPKHIYETLTDDW